MNSDQTGRGTKETYVKTHLRHVRANVSDLEKAINWYCTTLGFELDSVWPSKAPVYADFKCPEGAVFSIGVGEKVPGGARFNFVIQDVDAFWEKLRDKVDVVEQLFDTPYGTRKFTIHDLDGNELGFTKG
jgi:catechol 2,3-dioxygenase-like lactoylglutathione lyase family enzyme